jgi:tetrahydromethanopterin S-methyltransferase subunit B
MKLTLVILSFTIFGVLGVNASIPNGDAIHIIAGILISLIMAGMALGINIALFGALNPDTRRKHGYRGIVDAVLDGYLYMLPFLALAVLSTLLFKWQAAMSFASAAVMIGGATAGTEIMKKGAKGIKNMLIPSGVGFVITLMWMALLSLIPKL